jgi:hypothetical protein
MVTAAQLEARVTAERGRPDDAIARRLSSLELTERLSTARLQSLEAELPGTRSRQALAVLADYSAFLSLPPSEIPELAPPAHDVADQIAERAVQYLIQAIPALPNYMATRTTNRFESTPANPNSIGGVVVARQIHFEDAPAAPVNNKEVPDQPLRWIGISKEIVTVRDGSEFVEPADLRKKRMDPTASKMVSEGEFGTVLIGLITDAFHGKMSWSHWEARDAKPVAVFRYSVSEKDSHFAVFERAQGQLHPVYPAYHGEIAVDPDQGIILSLTMRGEWKPSDPNVRSDVFVEFASVDIGGKSYYCPSRSVALSVLHPELPNAATSVGLRRFDEHRTQTELNDIRFSDYHRFRTEMRILAGNEPVPAAASPAKTNPDQGPK